MNSRSVRRSGNVRAHRLAVGSLALLAGGPLRIPPDPTEPPLAPQPPSPVPLPAGWSPALRDLLVVVGLTLVGTLVLAALVVVRRSRSDVEPAEPVGEPATG